MLPPHSLPTAGMDARFQVIAGVPASPRCSIISAQPLVLNSPKTVISALARGFFSPLTLHSAARVRASTCDEPMGCRDRHRLNRGRPIRVRAPPLPSVTECARVTMPAREI